MADDRAADDSPSLQDEILKAARTEVAEGEVKITPDGKVIGRDVLITPDGEVIELSIVGTMNIGNRRLRERKNSSRIKSFKYALAGLLYVLRHETAIQIVSVITLIVVIVSFWAGLTRITWCILALALGSVWITECLNTAIEASFDMNTSDPHPMAKVGKDVAAAASLVSNLIFLIVIVLLVLPEVVDQLNAG